MYYRTNPVSNQKISLLGFGAMRFPTTEDGKIDRPRAEEMLDQAYKAGINYFDTAYMYHNGESQDFLGEVMKKYPRESFYITNKMPVWMAETKEDIAKIFEDQLKRCQVEYFDYYLIHAMSADRIPIVKELEVYEYLSQMKAEGKIRQLGFSFHDSPEVLEEICSTWSFDFAQIQLNYLDWEYQRAKEQYEVLCKHHLPCVVMEPVRGGALAKLPEDVSAVLKAKNPDASTASWAIRFAAGLENVMTVLSGMSDDVQVADNLKTMNDFKPLSEEEQDVLQEALALYRKNNLIPCTACRYCIDCPVSIVIPDIFRIYNNYKISGNAKGFLNDLKETEGCDSSACLTCGACSSKCPQHIDIPEELAKIRELADSLQ